MIRQHYGLEEVRLRRKIRQLIEQVKVDETEDLEEMGDLDGMDEVEDLEEADDDIDDAVDDNDPEKAWNNITKQLRVFVRVMSGSDADWDASAKSQVKKELNAIIDHAIRTTKVG